jgi:dUTP pyrophosphatase
MKIQIKYHNKNIPKIKKIEQGDLIDLYAAETVEMKAGEFKLISLGISVKLPWGYKAQVYPRSSTYKNWGIIQTNSVGQIDNSYCGDGDVWMYPARADRDTIIHEGDRICQFEVVPVMQGIEIEEVDSLSNVSRGGFGSTGAR